MSVLVFGRTGQLGRALDGRPGVVVVGRETADLRNPAACADLVRRTQPEAVINAAAYTDVDGAESSEDEARLVNAVAPGALATACAALDIPIVHVSTDYVFDGSGDQAWRPEDRPRPLNAYGRTKAEGEGAIREAAPRHAILRTAWVFAPDARNFCTAILAACQEKKSLRVVSDQIGGPTPAAALADACLTVARELATGRGAYGTYHFAGWPEVSRAELARAIVAAAGAACEVEEIGTVEMPSPARRPLNSRLDCSLTERTFGLARPDWRPAVEAIVGREAT